MQNKLVKERDQFKDEVKEVVEQKTKVEREKLFYTIQTKEQIARLNTEIKTLTEDLDKQIDELVNSQKQCKMLIVEREKMKQRISKLKNSKGRVDHGIKICRNCGKEFHEKENFNWSCRTHMSDFGGEMWWCCGKRGKDQPGCKFAKHECKDEDDEDDMNDNEKNKAKHMKYMRC